LILSLIILVKRKVKSKEIMMSEIEEVKEELGLNVSAKEISEDRQISINDVPDLQDDEEISKSHDLESSQREEPKTAQVIEEEKVENEDQEQEMMKRLQRDSSIDKLSQRPKKKAKRASKSEAAKIARYNIRLLEDIYQAYDPEQADHVVKVFRKGGVFSVEPIMEEDFEDSFQASQPDLESQNTDMNTTPMSVGISSFAAGGLKDSSKGKKLSHKDTIGKKDTLDDIKEENSLLFDEVSEEKKT